MKVVILIGVLLFSVAAAQQSQESLAKGVIYGTVVDQDGRPAAEIGLTADPLGMALGAILPHTKTDQNGKFRFANIPWWGRYTVYADDEEAGYSAFSRGPSGRGNLKEVTLSPEQPEAEFNFVLSPKAGFLKIHLMNQRTGKPLESLFVDVAAGDDPRQFFSMSCASTRVVLVPPDKDLFLHVNSPGFLEWEGSVGNGRPLYVHSGDRLTLDVALEPGK